MTNSNKYDILLGDGRRTDFLLPKTRTQSRFRKLNRFLPSTEMRPFLLEVSMRDKKGRFLKGCVAWNKNKIEKFCVQCNKRFEVSFSKNRLRFCSKKCSGINFKGHIVSKETRQKLAEINKKEKHPQWKGGITEDKNHIKLIGQRWKHNNREKCERYKNKRMQLYYNAGKLSIKTIQLVYEDNIKKYGTLTCYLCLQPIQFKQDCLEHKTPLSRGGTNEYNNLEIAHRRCNCKKNNKTEKEYREASNG